MSNNFPIRLLVDCMNYKELTGKANRYQGWSRFKENMFPPGHFGGQQRQ